ncbi:MAG TPA: hypothetical protein VGD65_20185, partial [Chryseosolibacter sp.]
MNEENDDTFLSSIGYSYPTNAQELESFNRTFAGYSLKADVNKIDPIKILSRAKQDQPATRIDFHKRTVLAAEIVFQLRNEWSLGHLKLQKLLYLCQNALQMPIHAKFLKQALGPYDPTLMRSLDKQFQENKWFRFDSADFPKYKQLDKVGGHTEWFNIYYKEHIEKINSIIATFRTMKSDDIELVATLFACWKDCLTANETVT